MKKLSLFFFFLSFSSLISFSQSQNFIGKWKTVDHEDGKTKSIVSIFKSENGKFYGKIEKLLLHKADSLCEACEGENKDKPVVGLHVLNDLEFSKGSLVNGTVLDPTNGKVYYCKISYNEKKQELNVRCSLDKRGLLSRTQYWKKHVE